MAVFGVPVTREDDARRTLVAVLALHGARAQPYTPIAARANPLWRSRRPVPASYSRSRSRLRSSFSRRAHPVDRLVFTPPGRRGAHHPFLPCQRFRPDRRGLC
jgi:hypothetical protein